MNSSLVRAALRTSTAAAICATAVTVTLPSASAAVALYVPGTQPAGAHQNFPYDAGRVGQQMAELATDGGVVSNCICTVWPTSGLNSLTFEKSIEASVPIVNQEIKDLVATGKPVEAIGLSNGSATLSMLMRYWQEHPDEAPSSDQLVGITLLGDPMSPVNGLLKVLQPFGRVPILDIPFYGGTPTDTPYKVKEVTFQYDFFSNFPNYWFAYPVATLNALLGFQYHINYTNIEFNPDPSDPGYEIYTKDNYTLVIKKMPLPLFIQVHQLVKALGLIALEPIVDVAEQLVKTYLVDPAYAPMPADWTRVTAATNSADPAAIPSTELQDVSVNGLRLLVPQQTSNITVPDSSKTVSEESTDPAKEVKPDTAQVVSQQDTTAKDSIPEVATVTQDETPATSKDADHDTVTTDKTVTASDSAGSNDEKSDPESKESSSTTYKTPKSKNSQSNRPKSSVRDSENTGSDDKKPASPSSSHSSSSSAPSNQNDDSAKPSGASSAGSDSGSASSDS